MCCTCLEPKVNKETRQQQNKCNHLNQRLSYELDTNVVTLENLLQLVQVTFKNVQNVL